MNEELFFQNRAAWRDWLSANHSISKGIHLVYYKKASGKPSIRYAEALEEALCFGWIDSTVRTVDAARYKQTFTPRRIDSNWSKKNKGIIADLIQRGLMTEAGLDKIRLAQQNGTWDRLTCCENHEIPADLDSAWNPDLKQVFQNLSHAKKTALLWHLLDAKRPETRAKRIRDVLKHLEGLNGRMRRGSL